MTKVEKCQHTDMTFIGQYSLVGYYKCRECESKIDPVEYAKNNGHLHQSLISYYEENPSKLKEMWKSHPWVRHIYEDIL